MLARVFPLCLIVVLLVACSPSSSPTSVASAPVPGPVVPVGEPEIRDLGPTTETAWNCGNGGGTVVKHPAMSVLTNYAVEWQVGGTGGVGVRIGDGVIPGGVDLSATLEGHYTTGLEQGIQQGTGWDLPAEPNTIVVYTLMWREKWQPGYVDVRLADQSVVRVAVRYRTGIQSEIVGKQRQSCGEESPPPVQQVTQQPIAPVSTQLPSEGTPSGITIPSGGSLSPSRDWVWICTGDFSITRPDGTTIILYDSSAGPTGLIVVLEQGSRVNINAPWGGYCEPVSPSHKGVGISTKISVMLSAGCARVDGCTSVNVVELDRNGSVLNNYWESK